MPSESVHRFYRFLNERLESLKKALDDLVRAFADNNQNDKVKAVATLGESIHALKLALSTSDCPGWLTTLDVAVTNYSPPRGVQANIDLLPKILSTYGKAHSQTWEYIAEDSKAVDLDQLYQECMTNSLLPELYEKLIELLQKIVDSHQIDSLDLLNRLEQLIATLRANRKGSVWSQIWSWQFARQFLKNSIIEGLKKVPGLDIAVQAVEKTIDQLDGATESFQAMGEAKINAMLINERPRIPMNEILRLEDKTQEAKSKPET